jgi:hypothetical protein
MEKSRELGFASSSMTGFGKSMKMGIRPMEVLMRMGSLRSVMV